VIKLHQILLVQDVSRILDFRLGRRKWGGMEEIDNLLINPKSKI
jgi:hypothetical protein